VLLDQLSSGEPGLRSELETLLAECEREDPLLDRSAAERFAPLFAEDPLEVPELLGERYRIVRELGRGGMAVVLLARDEKHGRDVAVKLVRPAVAAALGRRRFLQEIEIVARLHHPHIVSLFDSGESDGLLYYVMPFAEGPSLRHRLEREGRLPSDEVIRILRDVCGALGYAHQHGVVHGDIKPDNVMLAGRHALVTDFGIAEAISAATTSASDVATRLATLGTPAYMSPEQVSGTAAIDHRADIYAVGVLGYELLAGRPPFEGGSRREVLEAQLHQPPPVLALRPDSVSDPLTRLLMKCLAKRPEDRWDSADTLGQQLEALALTAGTAKRAIRRRSALLGTAALVLLAIAALQLRPGDSPTAALDPAKLVVLPFHMTGVDSTLRYLGEGVVDLLAAKLDGQGGPIAVDSRSAISAWRRETGGRDATPEDARRIAARLGAGEALLGSVVGAPDGRLTITATLIGRDGGAPRQAATLSGTSDSLPMLLDGIVTRLMAREAGVAEPALSDLTSRSLPALRAYLRGRAAYRRGQESEAIDHFARALENDSTFALAALDLAVASGQLLGQVLGQRTLYQLPQYVAARPESDHRRFAAAFRVALRHRDKLSPRDRPLADALSQSQGTASPRAMLTALERAAIAAPDRAETHYLIGALLLRQGPGFGFTDSRERASGSFHRALVLDSAYLAPLFGLVEAAALSGDSAELRRSATWYLSRASAGPAADYVRWRLAAGTGDAATLAALRERFDSLATPALERIALASQMSGVALEDADRAMALVVRRASIRVERNLAVMAAHWLALNRGRPREALRFLRLRGEVEPSEQGFWTHSTIASLFWDGDSLVGDASARARAQQLARDTVRPPRSPAERAALSSALAQDGLWALLHDDTARAGAAIRWLRRERSPGADLVDVLLATRTRRPDAEAILARLDSVAREGCCSNELVAWVNLVLARAYEAAGREGNALQVIRRGIWRAPPQLLSTYLREEGRLASRQGERAAALRAYRHYLALRTDPEPQLRAEVERVRAELARISR
jgi:tRNA A-37 threonylcarbamoyl transferase component Bud32/tetratricopeptide (TPR) repeat protein/TolB-like protein